MMSFLPNNISSLLERYSFKVDPDSANEDLTCNKCRMLINDVYQTYCGCTYCYECISEYLSEENEYCNGNTEDCDKQVLILEGNVSKSVFLNNKILSAKVICPNDLCSYSGYLTQMEDHLSVCTKEPMICAYAGIGCPVEGLTRETCESHNNDNNIEHSLLLRLNVLHSQHENNIKIESLNQNLKRLREDHDKEIKSLKEDSKKKDIRIKRQKREIEALQIRDAENRSVIDELSMKVNWLHEDTGKIGEITFPIDEIDDRMKISDKVMFSPYFYSHINGYKLQLAVYPGGISSGQGNHLSVFFKICKGSFDHLLAWPCKYTFHLSLVNHRTGCTFNTMTRSRDTATDNAKYYFQRPSTEDNAGCGYPKFISHSDLWTHDGLVLGREVIIECVVTPP